MNQCFFHLIIILLCISGLACKSKSSILSDSLKGGQASELVDGLPEFDYMNSGAGADEITSFPTSNGGSLILQPPLLTSLSDQVAMRRTMFFSSNSEIKSDQDLVDQVLDCASTKPEHCVYPGDSGMHELTREFLGTAEKAAGLAGCRAAQFSNVSFDFLQVDEARACFTRSAFKIGGAAVKRLAGPEIPLRNVFLKGPAKRTLNIKFENIPPELGAYLVPDFVKVIVDKQDLESPDDYAVKLGFCRGGANIAFQDIKFSGATGEYIKTSFQDLSRRVVGKPLVPNKSRTEIRASLLRDSRGRFTYASTKRRLQLFAQLPFPTINGTGVETQSISYPLMSSQIVIAPQSQAFLGLPISISAHLQIPDSMKIAANGASGPGSVGADEDIVFLALINAPPSSLSGLAISEMKMLNLDLKLRDLIASSGISLKQLTGELEFQDLTYRNKPSNWSEALLEGVSPNRPLDKIIKEIERILTDSKKPKALIEEYFGADVEILPIGSEDDLRLPSFSCSPDLNAESYEVNASHPVLLAEQASCTAHLNHPRESLVCDSQSPNKKGEIGDAVERLKAWGGAEGLGGGIHGNGTDFNSVSP